jgi:phage terminase large subunit-like protein
VSPAWLAYYESDGVWRPARHLVKLAELQTDLSRHVRERRPGVRHVMVNMPPQHGKTRITSRTWPVYHLGQNPDHHFMCVSYEAKFAESHGRAARYMMEAHGAELYGKEVDPERHASRDWGLLGHAGGMRSVGIGGAVAGNPATILDVDDPVKSHIEANSKGIRDGLFDWYRSSAYTRLAPSAAVLVVMTRWHEDDLCGRLLAREGRIEDGGKWEVVRLPAIADHDPSKGETDPLGRAPGEALWPEVRPLSFLAEARESVGSYWFDGMYQQNPSRLGGSQFKAKWFRYFRREVVAGEEVYVLARDTASVDAGGVRLEAIPARECWIFQTVDLATSVKTTADHTVISTWAVTPKGDLLLLDVRRDRIEGPDLQHAIRSAFEDWSPAFIGIESVAFQLSVVQAVLREGLPGKALDPGKENKASRAIHAATMLEGGKVFFLGAQLGSDRRPDWLAAWENELLNFDPMKSDQDDDQVDTFGYAARSLSEGGPRITVW